MNDEQHFVTYDKDLNTSLRSENIDGLTEIFKVKTQSRMRVGPISAGLSYRRYTFTPCGA